jgi:hypothetical protein
MKLYLKTLKKVFDEELKNLLLKEYFLDAYDEFYITKKDTECNGQGTEPDTRILRTFLKI